MNVYLQQFEAVSPVNGRSSSPKETAVQEQDSRASGLECCPTARQIVQQSTEYNDMNGLEESDTASKTRKPIMHEHAPETKAGPQVTFNAIDPVSEVLSPRLEILSRVDCINMH